ncbi:DUF4961 domain-containing protein [Proteiniphilum acetatigenes]|uniref:DUF4961 domain-containing protein n=1 Tax=Proteiniphilum acetatigenes TaxID=294710 RepID=UPI000374B9AF|nr:DUF4961 domain-containing protein [Proteiniphilum acetatigenes]
MQYIKKYKYALSLLVLLFLVVTCMTIEEIIHPDNAQVDSDINITVKIKIVAETDGNSKLAFGILMPKAWNVKDNAMLTLTTDAAFAGNKVTNEPMVLMSATDTNPTDGMPWASSFQSRMGVLGNTGPMEWVVFKSATTFQINDNIADQKTVVGTVNIKLHTGPRAVKFYAGYTFCGEAFGFHNEKYPGEDVVEAKLLEVTGGDEPQMDFTSDPAVSFVPATFGFGDIFSIRYNEPNYVTEGGLKDGDVHLYAKVLYMEGGVEKEKIVDEISDKTLMESLGNLGAVTSFQKYIYPREFFGLSKDADISGIQVHFTNKDKSVVILDNETQDNFVIEETCE